MIESAECRCIECGTAEGAPCCWRLRSEEDSDFLNTPSDVLFPYCSQDGLTCQGAHPAPSTSLCARCFAHQRRPKVAQAVSSLCNALLVTLKRVCREGLARQCQPLQCPRTTRICYRT